MIHALLSQLDHIVDETESQVTSKTTNDLTPASPPPSYTNELHQDDDLAPSDPPLSSHTVDSPRNFIPPPIFDTATSETTEHDQLDEIPDGSTAEMDLEDTTAVSMSAESHADDETVFGDDDPNPSSIPLPSSSRDHAKSPHEPVESIKEHSEEKPRSSTSSPSSPITSSHTSVTLSSLLLTADELYKRYPPTEPLASSNEKDKGVSSTSLDITTVLGPTSVLFTWSEDPDMMLSNDDAEAIVRDGLPGVVLENDGSSDFGAEEEEEKRWKEQEHRRVTREWDRAMRKRIVKGGLGVTVAVLVGLAAIALYSMERSASGNSNGKSVQEWRRSLGWIGGVLLSAGDRFIQIL